jgi:hypothetical protein
MPRHNLNLIPAQSIALFIIERLNLEHLMAEIISLHDSVKQFVDDGNTVALEGFTHLIPTAADIWKREPLPLTARRLEKHDA